MYRVYRNKSVLFRGETFETFEKARQALRKYIRANRSKLTQQFQQSNPEKAALGVSPFGAWDYISRNPATYTRLGYRIVKVQ